MAQEKSRTQIILEQVKDGSKSAEEAAQELSQFVFKPKPKKPTVESTHESMVHDSPGLRPDSPQEISAARVFGTITDEQYRTIMHALKREGEENSETENSPKEKKTDSPE